MDKKILLINLKLIIFAQKFKKRSFGLQNLHSLNLISLWNLVILRFSPTGLIEQKN